LQSVAWEDLLLAHVDNVEDMWEVFKNELLNRIDTFIPKMNCFQQIKKDSWSRPLPPIIREKISKKHRLWTRYMETRDIKIFSKYKSARNAVCREIRKINREQQQEVAAQCKENPKKFWKFINNKRNNRSGIGDLVTTDSHGNNVTITSNDDKANVLGNYFSQIFTKETKDIYDTSKITNRQSSPNPVNFCFDTDNILDKLTHLNIYKSPGPDGFHPRVLFEIRHEIVEPLQILYTASFCTGKLPSDWRSANITAVYKKGNKKQPSNYRPISLTSIICKIMESIIRDVIMEDFFNKGFFSDNQYGFIKGRSTVLQLLKIFDDWTYQMDQGVQIDVIYTDFEKAFDKVPHLGLISKLKAYDIDSKLIVWIEDFLCNRKQRIGVNGSFSQWYTVSSGIPQGSILGPILFLIFINDLPEICATEQDTVMYLYADDAKVYSTITCDKDHLHLQKVIDHIKEWCDQWLLPLNINKCFHMSYTSRLSIDTAYHINNTDSVSNIQKVDQIKDLGILYDSHLTFQDHIQEKINKAYSMIGLIKRNFIHMDSRTFIMLYKALVRPHVEYANSIWSPYKKGDIEAIEKVQKRATKLVISLKKLPYKERLLQLNLHTLKYRRLRGDMIEVYKITHDMYDRSVALELPRNVSSTRGNKYKLQNHSFHYNFRKFSFAARVVNVWNSLPDHVVDVNSLKQFETRLDKFWRDQDVMFDWTAEITGTGDRSEFKLETVLESTI